MGERCRYAIWLYIIGQVGTDGSTWPWVAYAIGVSDDPGGVLYSFQAGNPYSLELLAVFHDSKERSGVTRCRLYNELRSCQVLNAGAGWFWDGIGVRSLLKALVERRVEYKVDYLSSRCVGVVESASISGILGDAL